MASKDDPVEYDAGDLGCGNGLAREFRKRLADLPMGRRLRVLAKDPAAREDLPALARMLGHTVEAVGLTADGRIEVEVRRKIE